jgi:hypothetical protein
MHNPLLPLPKVKLSPIEKSARRAYNAWRKWFESSFSPDHEVRRNPLLWHDLVKSRQALWIRVARAALGAGPAKMAAAKRPRSTSPASTRCDRKRTG